VFAGRSAPLTVRGLAPLDLADQKLPAAVEILGLHVPEVGVEVCVLLVVRTHVPERPLVEVPHCGSVA